MALAKHIFGSKSGANQPNRSNYCSLLCIGSLTIMKLLEVRSIMATYKLTNCRKTQILMLCSDPLRVLPTFSGGKQVNSSWHQRCRRDDSITRFGQTNTLQELYCHYLVLDFEMHSQMGCTLPTHPLSQPLVWGHTGDPKGTPFLAPTSKLTADEGLQYCIVKRMPTPCIQCSWTSSTNIGPYSCV